MRVLTEVVEPLGMAGGPAMLLDGAGTASEKKKRKKKKKKWKERKMVQKQLGQDSSYGPQHYNHWEQNVESGSSH
jgi:hypothetical protein